MKQPPDWYAKPYGRDPSAWDAAVRRCRELLLAWARRGYVGTYSEVVDAVPDLEWPDGPFTHHGSQVGRLLGDISVGEWLEDRPLLSAVVISSQEGHPGKGFYDLARELRELSATSKDAELDYWQAEVRRCHEFWAPG